VAQAYTIPYWVDDPRDLGGVTFLLGSLSGLTGLAASRDPDVDTALVQLVSGGIVAASGVAYIAASGESARRLNTLLGEHLTALYRKRYVADREVYLRLREQYRACAAGSDTPLTATASARSAARSACGNYTTERSSNPRLASTFAEASTEVAAAIVAWDAVPTLEQLASGDYLGFYQKRETLPMKSLPAPVAQDVCDRVRDATGGKAIADDLLRKKLKSWAAETCPGGE
jgi:hypothetical protein